VEIRKLRHQRSGFRVKPKGLAGALVACFPVASLVALEGFAVRGLRRGERLAGGAGGNRISAGSRGLS
jgi:hypothetical protein